MVQTAGAGARQKIDGAVISFDADDASASSGDAAARAATAAAAAAPRGAKRALEEPAAEPAQRRSARVPKPVMVEKAPLAAARAAVKAIKRAVAAESPQPAGRAPPASQGGGLLAAVNAKVKKGLEASGKHRRAYFAFHRGVISPFSTALPPDSVRRAHVELFEQPAALAGDMRDYQLQGLNFLAKMYDSGVSCILGDEMGLGKTLQTIALLAHNKARGEPGAALVVCPLSVLSSWQGEFAKWCPTLRVLKLHCSDPAERETLRRKILGQPDSYDVVLTTYEMLKSKEMSLGFRRLWWSAVVLDEGHCIKNSETLVSKAVRALHFRFTCVLTGTPLQNNLVELWAVLNYLAPETFGTPAPFERAFDLGQNRVDAALLSQAHAMLKVFMLRRLKETVEKCMPQKVETTIEVPLAPMQLFWYRRLLLKDSSLLRRVEAAAAPGGVGAKSTGDYSRLKSLLMQLRKCCNHPFLFDEAEADIEATSLESLVAASGKLTVLDALLRKLLKAGHRCTVFSQFTRTLDILEDFLILRGIVYCRLDGSTSRVQRAVAVAEFNKPGSPTAVFLMSTRAGGLGLNLQTADTCILFDSDWNPQPDLQAMARVHRIGQTKVVHVYRLVSAGTVEERILQRAQKKLYLDKMVNSNDAAADDEVGGLDAGALLRDMTFGAHALFSSGGGRRAPTDAELDAIVDRTRAAATSFGGLAGGKQQATASFDATTSPVDTRALCGRTMAPPSNMRDIGSEWARVQAGVRQRKQRIVMVDGLKSGYGKKFVPVLASNQYTLEAGESSVFQRELQGRGGDYAVHKRSKKFDSEDACRICAAPTSKSKKLKSCTYCPTSICGPCEAALPEAGGGLGMFMCPQHACGKCHRRAGAVGNTLFRCASCIGSWCEECLPAVRILGASRRVAALGYASGSSIYVVCRNDACEQKADEQGEIDPPVHTMAPLVDLPALDLSDLPSIHSSDDFDAAADAAAAATPVAASSSLDSIFDQVDQAVVAARTTQAAAVDAALWSMFAAGGKEAEYRRANGHRQPPKWLKALHASHDAGDVDAAISRWVADGRLADTDGGAAFEPTAALLADIAAAADAADRVYEAEVADIGCEAWPAMKAALLRGECDGRRCFVRRPLKLCALSSKNASGVVCRQSCAKPCAAFGTERKRELFDDVLDTWIAAEKLAVVADDDNRELTGVPALDVRQSAVGINRHDAALAVDYNKAIAAEDRRVDDLAAAAKRAVDGHGGAWVSLTTLQVAGVCLKSPDLVAVCSKAQLQRAQGSNKLHYVAAAGYSTPFESWVATKSTKFVGVHWDAAKQLWRAAAVEYGAVRTRVASRPAGGEGMPVGLAARTARGVGFSDDPNAIEVRHAKLDGKGGFVAFSDAWAPFPTARKAAVAEATARCLGDAAAVAKDATAFARDIAAVLDKETVDVVTHELGVFGDDAAAANAWDAYVGAHADRRFELANGDSRLFASLGADCERHGGHAFLAAGAAFRNRAMHKRARAESEAIDLT
ncbi:SNF2 family N-terminal domain-containing protein [Pelagophyceae sp. CCMP2097]|nr:SNF2 family N-terminal domain-containing protein [Pelagophyceae sp. CCMP2097]